MAVDGIRTDTTKTQTVGGATADAVSQKSNVASQANLRVDAGSGAASAPGTSAGGPVLAAPPQMNTADLMVLLLSLKSKTTNARIGTAQDRINQRAQEKSDKHADIIKQIQKKMQNNPSIGNIFAQIFGWIGVLLTFIIAAVVGVVSGGAAAAPLVAAGVATMALMILQESGAMEKMMEGLSQNAKTGVSAGLAALMIVLNIAATIASAGLASAGLASSAATAAAETGETVSEVVTESASAAGEVTTQVVEEGASSGAELTENIVKTGEDIGEDAANLGEETVNTTTKAAEQSAEQASDVTQQLQKIGQSASKSAKIIKVAQKVRNVAMVANGVTMIGGGSTQVATSAMVYQATEATAAAKRDKAELLKLLALDEEDSKRIRELIKALQSGFKITLGAVEDAHRTGMKIATV